MSDLEAIELFKADVAAGRDWFDALLDAIATWTSQAEIVDGEERRYLIAGEAFDWLALARRLCDTVEGQLPEDQVEQLLFTGRPPHSLEPGDLRRRLGPKYPAHLNYVYGVTVEEALQHAVEEEVRKERRSRGLNGTYDASQEACRRIYGPDRDTLLRAYRKERGLSVRGHSFTLSRWKDFIYWLSKLRVANGEPARVASDTKKGLDELARSGVSVDEPLAASALVRVPDILSPLV